MFNKIFNWICPWQIIRAPTQAIIVLRMDQGWKGLRFEKKKKKEKILWIFSFLCLELDGKIVCIFFVGLICLSIYLSINLCIYVFFFFNKTEPGKRLPQHAACRLVGSPVAALCLQYISQFLHSQWKTDATMLLCSHMYNYPEFQSLVPVVLEL